MSRMASLARAEAARANGSPTDGITPVKNPVPEITPGLLGVIAFSDDAEFDADDLSRIRAAAVLMQQLDGNIEIRAYAPFSEAAMDLGIARAQRVYRELVGNDENLAARSVRLTVDRSAAADAPRAATVEILWRTPD